MNANPGYLPDNYAAIVLGVGKVEPNTRPEAEQLKQKLMGKSSSRIKLECGDAINWDGKFQMVIAVATDNAIIAAEDKTTTRIKRTDVLLSERDNELIPEATSQASITLYEGDSRKMQAADESGDFTITSPPYWDIEYYGDEPEQLGTGKSYEEFLTGLGDVAKENFRCLKSGAFCVWCINDFRRNGKFYSYHEDTADLLRAAGFVQHDICITDLGSSMRACFPNQVIETKILPKRHEYCLIFRKP